MIKQQYQNQNHDQNQNQNFAHRKMKIQKSSCALPHCVMQTRIAHELLVRVIMLGTPQMVWQKIPTNSETNRPNKTLCKRFQLTLKQIDQIKPYSKDSLKKVAQRPPKLLQHPHQVVSLLRAPHMKRQILGSVKTSAA